MILGKNYFAPIDEGEDYFYQVDSDQNEKYETLESIYNEIFTKEQTQEAKDLSLYIRNKNKYIDKSLTYGEVTFRSMAYIFEYCKSRFDIKEEGEFIDLGSGIGCGVLSAVLCFNFRKYIGIEFINALNNKAEINKKKFMDKFIDICNKYDEYLPEYIYDTELNNQIIYEIPNLNKKKKKDDKKEENLDENEAAKLQEEKLNKYMFENNNHEHTLNVLEMIFGKNNEDEEGGYASYAKKCKIRNEKFFEEYEKKQKEIKKAEEKEIEKERNIMARSPDYVKKGTVKLLLHGKDSILRKLESKKTFKDNNKKGKGNRLSIVQDIEAKEKSSESSDEVEKKKVITPYIEFICGNFINFDLTEASFIFCNSTCFSNELLLNISKKINKEAQVGCIVITFTKKLPFLNTKEWDIKKGFKRLMSWGLATVFVHRRIKNNKSSSNATSKKSGTKSGSNDSSVSSPSETSGD